MAYSYITTAGTNAANQVVGYGSIDLLTDIPHKDQLVVSVNDQALVLTTDYTVDSSTEQVTVLAATVGTIKIARSTEIEDRLVTFTNTSILTQQDLNKNTDQLLFLSQELQDQVNDLTLTSVSTIADNAITAAKLRSDAGEEAVVTGNIRDNAVTTPKIYAEAVTAAKLAPDAVETVKIQNAAVTNSKIALGTIAYDKLTTGAPTWTATTVTVPDDLAVTDAATVGGTLSFNSGYGSAGVAYGCRAWGTFGVSTLAATYNRPASSTTLTVTFNNHGLSTGDEIWLAVGSGSLVAGAYTITGTTANTFTVTTAANTAVSGNTTVYYVKLWASGNISRIGLTATAVAGGVFSVVFATSMPDENYAVMFGGRSGTAATASATGIQVKTATQSVSGFTIEAFSSGNTLANPDRVYFGVFR